MKGLESGGGRKRVALVEMSSESARGGRRSLAGRR